ncbi:MAG TPA: ROK family protein [Candidatus Dormibacteraeota bacterium]|nr:ROK family protein [Candidatus Dormibacteraeota bacterium]
MTDRGAPGGLVAGIDLGGTWARAAIAGFAGGLLVEDRRRTAGAAGPEPVVAELVGLVTALAARQGVAPAALAGLMVGVPGPVDPTTGIVESPPNLRGWGRVALARQLQERLGCPCLLENDANVAAWGEFRQGAGRGARNFVYVTVSTGIGAGLVLEGALYRGAQGAAGEFGHMVVDPDGPTCAAGHHGCLEAVASGTAIAAAAARALAAAPAGAEDAPGAVLRRLAGGAAPDAAMVTAAARAGDALALQVVDRAARCLGLALGGLINLLNPDVIAVGGGVVRTDDLVWTAAQAHVAEGSFRTPREHCRLVRAELGDDQGLIGAVEWARDRFTPR